MPADPKLAHVAQELPAEAPLIACRFDPTGKFVFATSENRSIYRWELAGGKRAALAGHDSWVFDVAVTSDGRTLISAGGDDTLIVVLSEFGRTPKINANYGRDHWGTAWSICLGGAGIHRGAVIGETVADGTAVKSRQVDGGHLFHTYLSALGIKSTGHFMVAGQKMPMADPAFEPIDELLS